MNAADRKKLQTDLWRESALLVGERLRDNGPMDYYKMTAIEWRDWALETAVSRNRAEVAEARAKELQEEIGQRDYALGCAKQMQDWQQNRWEAAKARVEELEALFALQQTRMAEAVEAWRKATRKQDTLPDLGDLLTWLMDRPAALEKATRQVIKASPKYVGKEMLLALAELDTALAEGQGGALIGVLVEEKKDPWPTVTSWSREGKEESREM